MKRKHQQRLPFWYRTIRRSYYPHAPRYGRIKLSQFANWAGREKPVNQGAASAIPRRFLLSGRFMAAGSGQRSRWPVLGPVSHPTVSPPPITVRSDVADSIRTKESIVNTSIKGAIRPFPPTSNRYDDALIVVESCGIMIEQILTGKLTGSDVDVAVIAGGLRQAADLIDGGRRHE